MDVDDLLQDQCEIELPIWLMCLLIGVYCVGLSFLFILGISVFIQAKLAEKRILEEYQESSEMNSEDYDSEAMEELKEMYEIIPDQYVTRASLSNSDTRSSLRQINEETEEDSMEDIEPTSITREVTELSRPSSFTEEVGELSRPSSFTREAAELSRPSSFTGEVVSNEEGSDSVFAFMDDYSTSSDSEFSVDTVIERREVNCEVHMDNPQKTTSDQEISLRQFSTSPPSQSKEIHKSENRRHRQESERSIQSQQTRLPPKLKLTHAMRRSGLNSGGSAPGDPCNDGSQNEDRHSLDSGASRTSSTTRLSSVDSETSFHHQEETKIHRQYNPGPRRPLHTVKSAPGYFAHASPSNSISSASSFEQQHQNRRISRTSRPVQRSNSQYKADIGIRMLYKPEEYASAMKEFSESTEIKRSPTGRKLSEISSKHRLHVPTYLGFRTGSNCSTRSDVTHIRFQDSSDEKSPSPDSADNKGKLGHFLKEFSKHNLSRQMSKDFISGTLPRNFKGEKPESESSASSNSLPRVLKRKMGVTFGPQVVEDLV